MQTDTAKGGIPVRTYTTAQVAKIIGVHPNTVRLYEKLGFIPKTKRRANGYRVFHDLHLRVFRIARTAFQIEVLQNGLRRQMMQMVKTAAAGDVDAALSMTDAYIAQLRHERQNAREAIEIARQILSGDAASGPLRLKRQETAALLCISTDTLRNWEMNGLLSVRRLENGYRVYSGADVDRLKIIRSLRCAGYSLEAILHMLTAFSADPKVDLAEALDTPEPEEDTVISVCDKLLTSLALAEKNAGRIKDMLHALK